MKSTGPFILQPLVHVGAVPESGGRVPEVLEAFDEKIFMLFHG